MNNSDIIRWSLDLRWQRADKNVAFYDLKQGVRMRSSTDPNIVIDWDTFIAANRSKAQQGPGTTWHSEAEVSCVLVIYNAHGSPWPVELQSVGEHASRTLFW